MSGFWPYVAAVPPCSGKAMPGTRYIQMAILERFDRAMDYGIYNCRALTTNASVPSIHSDGRAGDTGFPDAITGNRYVTNPHPQGFQLVELLRANAYELGIMGIIWNSRRYDWRTPFGREYVGPSPHRDHVHWENHPKLAVELTRDDAYRLIGGQMAFTSAEEMILKQVAAQGTTLLTLARSLTSPGPTTGKVGTGQSLVWVLEWYRHWAESKGVTPLDPKELARLLGQ